MNNEPSQFRIDVATATGTTPKNNDKITDGIKRAKTALNITTSTRYLTDEQKFLIIQWLECEQLSLSDNKQVDIESIVPAIKLPAIIEEVETVPVIVETIQPVITDDTSTPTQRRKRVIDLRIIYDDYESVQMRFYTGDKRQFVVIEGWLLNALMVKEKLDKRQLPEWIENRLIIIDGVAITKQVNRLIVCELLTM